MDVVKLLCKKANLKASYVEGRLRLAERERSRQISAATAASRRVAAAAGGAGGGGGGGLGARTGSQPLPDHLLQVRVLCLVLVDTFVHAHVFLHLSLLACWGGLAYGGVLSCAGHIHSKWCVLQKR